MKILGIETSCDETAAAVVEDGRRLLSNVVASSMDEHVKYGGIVPEVAARAQIESIMPVIEQALAEAFPNPKSEARNSKQIRNTKYQIPNTTDPWDQIDGIAVTYGAGLGGSLLVGVLTARTLAIIKQKSLYAINHVEAHLYANFLVEASLPSYKLPKEQPEFPMLGLIVSGGHTQLVLFKNHFDYQLLGQTQDDAIGEAFDKVAKVLGLPYPGGPSLAKIAQKGDPHKYKIPIAQVNSLSPGLIKLRNEMQASSFSGLDGVQGNNEKRGSRTDGTVSESRKQLTQQSAKSISSVSSSAGHQAGAAGGRGYDFSFSGPKTAVLRLVQQLCAKPYDFPSFKLAELLDDSQKADVAASFQFSAVKTVVDKTLAAVEEYAPKSVVIGGGVASSAELRRQLADRLPLPIDYADPKLCTDNGAMVATLGYFKAKLKQPPADPYKIDISPNLSM